ncbi:HRDC domain-containing protein [Nanchangia anserum]|uniref:HRDC domain-containing protein n=1 Tax=Nanchangia anserum TaxID=2692125 RepID=A0A8I0GC38_9ACTO|nr:HRDC domain-containing protein [Nanchangia anserum]MBD3688818.1 HRDC domain-containing protein [Nanchangia anserum]QOX81095.1 HRDC domain-containing protein [Nanchangia anserum]
MTESAVPVTETPRGGIPDVCANADDVERAYRALAAGHGPLLCDVERAAGYVYSHRAYLVQLARAGSGIWLLDPIAAADAPAFAAIGELMGDNEVVLHAADQDLENLRELGMAPGRLFDTELAARLLGMTNVSLAGLHRDLLGIHLAKAHQTSDWSRRPLPDDWRAYAALDVDYLGQIRDILAARLVDAGREEWAEQECDHVLHAAPKPAKSDPWRVSGAGKLRDRRQLAALRALWQARDELGRRDDREPAKYLATRALVPLAELNPTSVRSAMRSIPELKFKRTRQHLDVWQNALDEARALDETELPPLRRAHEPGALAPMKDWRYRAPSALARLETIKAGLRAVSDVLGIRADLVLAPAAQRRLAWEGATEGDIEQRLRDLDARPWQIRLTRDLLERALAS